MTTASSMMALSELMQSINWTAMDALSVEEMQYFWITVRNRCRTAIAHRNAAHVRAAQVRAKEQLFYDAFGIFCTNHGGPTCTELSFVAGLCIAEAIHRMPIVQYTLSIKRLDFSCALGEQCINVDNNNNSKRLMTSSSLSRPATHTSAINLFDQSLALYCEPCLALMRLSDVRIAELADEFMASCQRPQPQQPCDVAAAADAAAIATIDTSATIEAEPCTS
jgi:hypothetical protein